MVEMLCKGQKMLQQTHSHPGIGHEGEIPDVPKTRGGAAAPPRSVLAVAETSCGYQLNIEENDEPCNGRTCTFGERRRGS